MGELSTSTSQWLQVHQSLGISLIDHLYNRMDGMYPNRWRAAFSGDVKAIENWRHSWAEAFAEEGISPDEIKAGIIHCRRMFDWPPSLPEFIKACRPAIDYEWAFLEAVEQHRLRETGKDAWSSPVIYWAAASIGNDLQNHHYGAVSKRWAAAMDKARDRIRSGELPNEVPPRREALPPPGRQSVSQEQAAENISRIKAMIQEAKISQGVK